MIDLDAIDQAIRERVRSQVPEIASDNTAEELDEAVMKRALAPAIFTMITEPEARDKAIGTLDQVIELDIRIGVVTASFGAGGAAAMRGSRGNYALRQKVKRALHGWLVPGTLKKLRYRGNEQPIRADARIGVEQRYTTSVHETYSA